MKQVIFAIFVATAEKLPAAIAKAHDVLSAPVLPAPPGYTAADIWQAINQSVIAGFCKRKQRRQIRSLASVFATAEKPSITPDDKTILQTAE